MIFPREFILILYNYKLTCYLKKQKAGALTREERICVFYSWQSGTYEKEAQHLINRCLNNAAKALIKTSTSVRIEQDMRGDAGSADIPQTLFQKIRLRMLL